MSRGLQFVLAATVVLAIALGSGVAGATGDGPICNEVDDRVVVAEFVDGAPYDESGGDVYPGTQLELYLCNDGEIYDGNEGWLDGGDGFTKHETEKYGGYGYRVEVTGTVEFGEQVRFDNADGPTVSVREPVVYDSEIDGIGPLVFADEENRTDYETAEAAFLEARAAAAEPNDTVAALTAEIEAGERSGDDLRATADDVAMLDNHRSTLTERRTELEELLANDAIEGTVNGTPDDLAAISAAEREPRLAETRADYENAVDSAESRAVSKLRTYLGGAAVVGVLLGAIAGVAVPRRIARSVEEALVLDATADYDRNAALVPIGVGLVLAIVGIAVVVAFVSKSGIVDLFGVIR